MGRCVPCSPRLTHPLWSTLPSVLARDGPIPSLRPAWPHLPLWAWHLGSSLLSQAEEGGLEWGSQGGQEFARGVGEGAQGRPKFGAQLPVWGAGRSPGAGWPGVSWTC